MTRHPLPDLLRAFALIGIVLVNVELFSHGVTGYPEAARATLTDRIVSTLVFGVFTMKSFSLFSMMFGAGLGYQMLSAERAASDIDAQKLFSARYFRRMLGLVVLGILHAIFLFSGDILLTYGVLGCILFLFRDASPKTMIIWGLIFIGIQALILLSLSVLIFGFESLPEGEMRTQIFAEMERETAKLAAADEVFKTGSFLDIAITRLKLYPIILQSIPMVQGVAALGFFLLGLGAMRKNWFTQSNLSLWTWSRYLLLPAGLILSTSAGWAFSHETDHESAGSLFCYFLNMVASPMVTFGFVGWLVKLSDYASNPVLQFFAKGGSASLTAYLMQSVILCWVFVPFGLGLFGTVTVGSAVLIALGAGVFSVVLTAVWRSFFSRGPAEILLRRWTYLGE